MEPLFAVNERVTWSRRSDMAAIYGSGTFVVTESWIAAEKGFCFITRVTRPLVQGVVTSVDGVPFEESHFILSSD